MTIHFSPEFVRMIGWALLHFVWQGAVVAALLSLFLAFCQRATVRYAAAAAALLLMLALPFATFFVLQQPTDQPSVSGTSETSSPVPARSILGPVTKHAKSAPIEEPSNSEPMMWLVRLWMVGVILFSVRSAGGFLLVQRLRAVATEAVSGELLQLCLTVQKRMGIERAVRFCRSAGLQVPAVVGGLRPIVLLPITALTGLTDSQIEAVVAHELAHIQRLDYFVNLFQVFAETVLFYHPAVWWVNKQIRSERENCCDDTAIAVCGDRLNYVRALTHLESMRMMPQFAMAANGSPLKARVRRLLGMSEEREGIRSSSSLLGGIVIAGLVLASTTLATGAKAQDDKPALATAPVVAPAVEPVTPEILVKPVIDTRHMILTPRTMTVKPVMTVRPVLAVAPVAPVIGLRPMLPHLAIAALAPQAPMVAFKYKFPAVRIQAILAQANASAGSAEAHTSESYVDGMKAAGFGDLTVDDLVAMKIQGVTPEYVRDMRAAGFKFDADELIGMKIQGVTPQYAKELRAAYPGIDTDTIIGMKIQGVTPEYVAELAKLGVKGDADALVGMKIQGVSPEYVRDMRATGITFDSDELIGMKIQGVTPAYVNALKSAGLGKLDADEIVGAKVMGITPEFIDKAKSHGFKDLDLDKLIQLKNAGVL